MVATDIRKCSLNMSPPDDAPGGFLEGVAAYQNVGYQIYEKQLPCCEGAVFLNQHCSYEKQGRNGYEDDSTFHSAVSVRMSMIVFCHDSLFL